MWRCAAVPTDFQVDVDGSGYITFDELEDVVRHKLKKGPKVISQNTLKAMWCIFDEDNSNSIMKDEMAGFFKMGAPEKKKPAAVQRERTAASLVGAISVRASSLPTLHPTLWVSRLHKC